MSLPNSLLKIISKRGDVVDFDIERIVRSIRLSMVDVRGSTRWGHDLRSRKYAEKVRTRIYREFYDLGWLKSDFLVKYLNYKPEERIGRLKSAAVTERLTFALLETFNDYLRGGTVEKHAGDLKAFIDSEIRNARIDSAQTEATGITPSEAEFAEIAEFLNTETLQLSRKPDLPLEILYPHREYVQDMIEKELKDLGEIDIAEAYMVFREGRRKIHAGDISPLQFTNNGIHRELVNRTLSWNITNECETVLAVNDWIIGRRGKKLEDLIAVCEKRYHDDVKNAAAMILARKEEVKVVVIAGPSCSNKTTTTVIIGQELQKHGLKLKQLNVDNYFFDLAQQPKDEFGDYDFEMPESIEISLLNQHLEALTQGRSIQMPHYNFKKGCRDGYTEFSAQKDEIILIDCLHGLYRKLTESVSNRNKFKIYIESMNVVRNTNGAYTKWADVRMLKRMIRDSQHRGYGAEHTLAHWPYVRKGELKHIIPYIFSTDVVLNSGLPYELPVLKKVLKECFPTREVVQRLLEQGRFDPYIRGVRVRSLIDTVEEFPNLDLIPSTSPIREFIGGSSYIIPHND